FYNNAIANLPQTWNRDGAPVGRNEDTVRQQGDRNELSAMFLGYARDGRKFSEILWKNWVYYLPCYPNNPALNPYCGFQLVYQGRPDVHFKDLFREKSPRDILVGDIHPNINAV